MRGTSQGMCVWGERLVLVGIEKMGSEKMGTKN